MARPGSSQAAVLAQAGAWRDQDPDEETRAELDALIAAAAGGRGDEAADALAELHSRFDTRLAFGTAGLRGRLAAGPARMNRVLVAQAARGLADHLLAQAREAGTGRPSVVIGYDGRKNSEVFATDTAELMTGAGVRAILLPRMLPTPVLAFAVRHLAASAGVMVTASHNPPQDNGYKVYLGGADAGSQIIPPADRQIAARIAQVAESDIRDLPRGSGYERAGESVIDAYVARAAAAAARLAGGAELGEARVVYTAMHGVGWRIARRVFQAAGIPEPAVVAEQIDPDPAFPTVAFPNPEEEGALDLAFEAGRRRRADLVIANDPDADRLAVAVPDPDAAGGYRRLTGNEVGLLLGWALAEARRPDADHHTLAASVVSSPGLRRVAALHGLDYTETLTGFKWVSRAPGLLYGFEEALGYLVDPDAVRDKDGISAAAVFITMARMLAARGSTVGDRLDAFAARFGAHASRQVAVRVTDTAVITAAMARLREHTPERIGGVAVTRVEDLARGDIAGLPASDVLRIHLADGSRLVARPSGTEPKLKIYLDAVSEDGDAHERRAAAERRVTALARDARSLIGQ